jgi:hypothetical protein
LNITAADRGVYFSDSAPTKSHLTAERSDAGTKSDCTMARTAMRFSFHYRSPLSLGDRRSLRVSWVWIVRVEIVRVDDLLLP